MAMSLGLCLSQPLELLVVNGLQVLDLPDDLTLLVVFVHGVRGVEQLSQIEGIVRIEDSLSDEA